MIVRVVPVWEGEEVKGFKVFVAGEVFEVKQVFVDGYLEKDPSYDVFFIEAKEVRVYGADEVDIYTRRCGDE